MKKYFLLPLGIFFLLVFLSFFEHGDIKMGAADLQQIIENIGGYGSLPMPEINSETTAEGKIVSIIALLINIILLLAGSASTAIIVIGAVRLAISSGDEDMINGGKKMVIWAVVGLLVVILSYAIMANVLDFLLAPDRG
jgi:hypothetical protein